MKKFLKNASVYILLMLLIAAIIFSGNYFYGQKISDDLEARLRKKALENNYQLRFINIETNPLLREIDIQNLDLRHKGEFNLILNQLKINFSWQQILNYIKNNNFQFDKNFKADIAQINYFNIINDYQLNFKDSELKYQGKLKEDELVKINNLNDLNFLLENNHNLDFRSKELKFDFVYHRSLGLDSENWNKLSTFSDFAVNLDYNKEDKNLKVQEFKLTNNILKIVFDLDSRLNYAAKTEKINFENIKSNYDFLFMGDKLELADNLIFEDLALNQLNLNGNFDLTNTDNQFLVNDWDFDLKIKELKLLFSKAYSRQLNSATLGIMAGQDNFEVLIDNLNYKQNFSYPQGNSETDLKSSLIDANLNAEYNYSEEKPYISSAKLRYKTKTPGVKQLNSFLQIILSQQFTKDQDEYYEIEIWGPIDDLNYK